jgi:hypothetical protein
VFQHEIYSGVAEIANAIEQNDFHRFVSLGAIPE